MKPLYFSWDGEAMVPLKRSAKACDEHYVIGRVYCLEAASDRSMRSHRHYFAAVHEAWLNLPEEIAEQFPSSEHLRKHALIRAGYYEQRMHPCSSPEAARDIAAFIRPIDEYAIVTATDNVVRVFTAKSQSVAAMGKKEFQKSKERVLEIVSLMIGVKPDDLGKAAA